MWNLINKLSNVHLKNVMSKYSAIVCRHNSGDTTIVKLPKPNLRRLGVTKTKIKRDDEGEASGFLKWLVLGIPVGSFLLGCWQTKRLQWKLDLISKLKEKTSAEPVPLPLELSELSKMEFAPVRVRGRFLHEREMLVGPRALIDEGKSSRPTLMSDPKQNQGWLVVTPFQLSDSQEVILVNRGWIPKQLKPRERRAASNIDYEVELTGLVRLTENRPQFMMKNDPATGRWQYRDLDEMSAYANSLPVWLDARGEEAPPGWPVPNQTRVTLRNEHLAYLVTWYSLSAITGFMWYRQFIMKLPLL